MRIPELKPKSPDFYERSDQPENRACDIPGCPYHGIYPAPKSRSLDDYYHFCTDHIIEYNKNWNFFEGMSQAEIEQHMYRTMTWDRPTWESTLTAGINPEYLKRRVFEGIRLDGFDMGGGFAHEKADNAHYRTSLPAPEVEALSTLDLTPPVDWQDIRRQYKKLVKQHHPDVSTDKGQDEMIKKINIAYSILKLAYQKFEKLEKRTSK